MKVTYIEHSGFFLSMEEADFLFDYYKGEIPQREKEKPLFVFVSHRHPDHYNPMIFELIKKYPNTNYILSKDVPVKKEIKKYREQGIGLKEHMITVVKNDVQIIDLPDEKSLKVETFKSTDEGVAFLLEYEGRVVYHAGDLNLWVWEGESRQYNENMTGAYFNELEKFKNRTIDIAFLPLDPRQEKDAFSGMESFLASTNSRQVFPMHFWGKYEIIDEFLTEYPEYKKLVKRVEYSGQSFETK